MSKYEKVALVTILGFVVLFAFNDFSMASKRFENLELKGIGDNEYCIGRYSEYFIDEIPAKCIKYFL